MKSYRQIVGNRRGSITPFAVIIATTFIAIFIMMFSVLHKVSYMNTQKDYLSVASDDLLSSFDEVLLMDYGLLAYDKDDALEKIKSSVKLNTQANEASYFIKETLTEEQINQIDYSAKKSLANKQELANTLVEIAELHVPLEAIQELNDLYSWSDKMKEKAKAYDKYDDITKTLESFTKPLEECANGLEKINEGIVYNYRVDTRTELLFNSLAALKKENRKTLTLIKKLEKDLKNYSQSTKDLPEDIGQLKADTFMFEVDESIRKFRNALSGSDKSISEVKDDIRSNIELIERVQVEGNFDLLEELEADFYVYDDDESDGKLKEIFNFFSETRKDIEKNLDGNLPKEIDSNPWEVNSTGSSNRVSLNPAKKLLLNEYFLATLKSRVDSPVRNFEMLRREERTSSYSNGEVEYLITENKNRTEIRLKIIALRMGPNTLHLLSDKEKFNLIKNTTTKIAAVNPIAGIVASVAIVGGWSGIESVYDLKELEHGRGIPFMKTDADWYFDIDLERQMQVEKVPSNSDADDKTFIESSAPQTLSYYNDYLRILLFLTNDSKKIDRYLKVISDNIKKGGNRSFDKENYVISHEITWKDYLIQGDYYEK